MRNAKQVLEELKGLKGEERENFISQVLNEVAKKAASEERDAMTSENFIFTKSAECKGVDDIDALEARMAAFRAAYQTMQDESMKAITAWFKIWRHTEAAKGARQHTENFTRIFSAPATGDETYFNDVRAHAEEEIWSVVSLTTPAKWSNAIAWANKVAAGKVCKTYTRDASKLTKAQATERAAECVKCCMGTDLEDEALTIWYNCKGGKYEGLIELELKLSKLQEEQDTDTDGEK